MHKDNFKVNYNGYKESKIDKIVLGGLYSATFALIMSQMLFPINYEPRKFTSTAIIMEDGNATIVDLESYEKDLNSNNDNWILYTMDGEVLIYDSSSIRIITSENSRERAEEVALEIVGEDGNIIYDNKDASKALKLTL